MTNQPTTQGNSSKSKRYNRRMSPTMEEATRLVKNLKGRNKLYGMMSTNDRGDVTEIGVYNGNTKRYALYRSELVDSDIITEFKEIMGSNSQ